MTRFNRPKDFYWPAVIVLFTAALYFLGWFRGFAQAGVISAILMLIVAAGIFAVIAILLPVAFNLASSLFTGDPYWIAPRPFDARDDERKTAALLRRLSILASDREAALWQDRETGQLWAARRFSGPDGDYTLYKPLPKADQWTGMADEDWERD